jgi:two-component system, OmpR family, response regulator
MRNILDENPVPVTVWGVAAHREHRMAMVRSRLLLVEDDRELAGLVASALRDSGHDVHHASSLAVARARIAADHWHALILDAQLPDGDGFDLCREQRDRRQVQSVILLTARASGAERIAGLECGADDYLTKPFELRELSLRVANLLRRQEPATGGASDTEILNCGDIAIDLRSRQVSHAGQPLTLTPREFDLLAFLAAHPEKVFSRGELLSSVWGSRYEGFDHTVNAHINRLRAKLESDPRHPRHLVTVWGSGYRLVGAS